MDTSVTIIGIIITILIAIPLTFILRSNSVNKSKIKAIKKQYSQNNLYNFEVTESQNKKIISIDLKKKGLLFIDFSYKKDIVNFIDLNKIHSCKIIPTTSANSSTILKLELEFLYTKDQKKELIPIYNIDNQFLDPICLYEDHQLAKKWVKIIDDCISK
ncbi:hypothetical protein [Flavobacterium aestivum]|uniref:hypothetical protein n=1 Tax=Flavobacterium aestivum TaxID=3003257 RepID=UPI00228685A4|nr:hypothetical protein [Flavobacterium aestivum]